MRRSSAVLICLIVFTFVCPQIGQVHFMVFEIRLTLTVTYIQVYTDLYASLKAIGDVAIYQRKWVRRSTGG